MLQISQDAARGFQTLVEGGVANIGTHYHLPPEKFETMLKVVLKELQFPRAEVPPQKEVKQSSKAY